MSTVIEKMKRSTIDWPLSVIYPLIILVRIPNTKRISIIRTLFEWNWHLAV